MHCQNCGASLSADATRCPECGVDAPTPDGTDPSATGPDERGPTGRDGRGPTDRQRGQGGNRRGQSEQRRSRNQRGQPQRSQQPQQPQRSQQPQQPQQRQQPQQPQQERNRPDQPRTAEPQAGHAEGRAPPAGESGGSSVTQSLGACGITRLGAVGGGLLAGFTVTLPWVEAELGGMDADAMATLFGPVVLIAAAVAVLATIANWGRGWGWLSMILTGVAGVAVAGTGAFAQSYLSETTTLNTVEVDGRDIPVAAVEPGGGVEMAMLAGGVLVVAALAGIVGTLVNR